MKDKNAVALGEKKAELVIKDARYLNVFTGEILKGDIAIENGYIVGIGDYEGEKSYYTDGLVIPGFIDGHVHIESSMATPRNFAAEAKKHGTTTVVCDPHEIANVAGEYGIEFMLKSAACADIDFKFMLPSCVPATPLDQNYKALDAKELHKLYKAKDVIGLAEVMDVGAVISGNDDMYRKIKDALSRGYRVDGHAPSLCGKPLNAYVMSGISSDHECTAMSEALEKLRLGQFIMIRQGTAAHNLRELLPLIDKYYNRCMFVTDDLHPEGLMKGHIDSIVREAVSLGADKIKTLISATYVPAMYFGLDDRGAIAPGRRADLAVLSEELFVIDSFFGGKPKSRRAPKWEFSSFDVKPIELSDIKCEKGVIGLVPGQLLTRNLGDNYGDCVKLLCVERHHGTGHKAACYLSGYGIKEGAVATSIAHDSHNIIAAGSDEYIVKAVNKLIEMGGGIVVVGKEKTMTLPLEIGGIMSEKSVKELATELEEIKNFAYSLGVSRDIDPFMTLSFLSLPVIPEIRLLPSGIVKI